MRAPALLLIVPILLLAACGGKEAAAPPDPRHVAIYADLASEAGVSGEAAPDSVREEVFRRHRTTRQAYQEALEGYRADARRWALFFSAVTDTLEARVR